MVALLLDETARREVDLLRVLYDREAVDHTAPHIPLVGPFDEPTAGSDLAEMVGLIVGVHPPFLMELSSPQRFFDGNSQLLQFVAGKGAEESRRLAAALSRDVFPHHQPASGADSAPPRVALTVGRFRREEEAERAAAGLGEKAYFLVVTQVGVLEAQQGEGKTGWAVARTLSLGEMIADGA